LTVYDVAPEATVGPPLPGAVAFDADACKGSEVVDDAG
jgi:hypothetical protein